MSVPGRRVSPQRLAICLSVLGCLIGACSETGTAPASITSVQVSPDSATLTAVGQTQAFSATVGDAQGRVVPGVSVTWSSSDPTVATVDSAGLATAAGNGTVVIRARASGLSDSATLAVNQVVMSVGVSPESPVLGWIGDTVRFTAEGRDMNGHPVAGLTFGWVSSDTSVVTVDGAGLATARGWGSALIQAFATNTSEHQRGSGQLAVERQVPVLRWERTNGPYTAWVEALAWKSGGYLFAGAEPGLFMSTDDGSTWVKLGSHPPSADVQSITVAPDGTIYTANWESPAGGLQRSTDNGAHWSSLGLGAVSAVAWNSRGYLFAGSLDGIDRSTDDGASWTRMNAGLQNPYVYSVCVGPDDVVYAGTLGGGVYRSTDDAVSWAYVGPAQATIMACIVLPDSSLLIGDRDGTGVYRSFDDGDHWQGANTGLGNRFIRRFELAATGELYVGTRDGVFRSLDSGGTWSAANSGMAGMWVRGLTTNDRGEVFAGGSRTGIYRSTNGGQDWQQVNTGLTGVVRALLADGEARVYAGSGNQVFVSADGGGSWTSKSDGLSGDPNAEIAALSRNSNGHFFAATVNGDVYRSLDGGLTWVRKLSTGSLLSGMAVAPNGDLYVGTETMGLWRSNDDGDSWQSTGLSNNEVLAIAVDSSGKVFAGAAGGLYRSTDGGATWTLVLAADPGVSGIVTGDPGVVVAATWADCVLYRSEDNGDHWFAGSRYGGSCVLSSDRDGRLYVGNNFGGVSASADNGATWQVVNDGLTNRAIFALTTGWGNYLLAGTLGDGVFRSTIGP